MGRLAEPAVGRFFASPRGVCVYVTIGRRAIRVEFTNESAPGTTADCSEEAASAARAAVAVFTLNRAALRPLFQKVESEPVRQTTLGS